jgi:hypothetical protein
LALAEIDVNGKHDDVLRGEMVGREGERVGR